MWQKDLSNLLAERIGLDPASLGETVVRNAVEQQMRSLGLADPVAYVARLGRFGSELDALIESVVVPESWFFRDRQPFARLQQFVRDEWLRTAKAGRPVRILSIPCAAGEEAYSIAIAMLEIDLSPQEVHIDAVDISTRALEQARRGVYNDYAFRERTACDWSQYFREQERSREVIPKLREMVRFQRGNLLDAAFLIDQPAYDVVFCRNLLIYLTRPARERVVAVLKRLLAPNGLLFVGHAEMSSILDAHFVPDADRSSFAYRPAPDEEDKAIPRTHAPRGYPRPDTLRRGAEIGKPSEIPARAAERPAVRAHAERGHEEAVNSPVPGADRDTEKAQSPVDDRLLDRAADLANQQQYTAARQLCERSLQQDGPTSRAYFLLGMMAMAEGTTEQAEVNLSKAVYLDGSNEEAFLALALLAQRRGDQAGAARYRQRAERLHRGKEES